MKDLHFLESSLKSFLGFIIYDAVEGEPITTWQILRSQFILIFFAILMLALTLSSIFMCLSGCITANRKYQRYNDPEKYKNIENFKKTQNFKDIVKTHKKNITFHQDSIKFHQEKLEKEKQVLEDFRENPENYDENVAKSCKKGKHKIS